MSESSESFAFLVLCRDLLLSSKILATARAVSVSVKQVRSADTLNAVGAVAPALIVDLNEPGFLDAAASWKRTTGGRVIGFAGHADTLAFDNAHANAFDKTFARGAFVAQLETILSSTNE